MCLSYRLFGVFAVLAVTSLANAAQYHVSPDGSDKADGSAGAPFATIQHAADLAKAGDEVIIHDGLYRQSVTLKSKSDAKSDNKTTAPIVFKAKQGANPVITGALPLTGPWQDLGDGVFAADLPKDGVNIGWVFIDGKPGINEWSYTPKEVNAFSHDTYGPLWDHPPVPADVRPAEGQKADDAQWQLVQAEKGLVNVEKALGKPIRNSLVFAMTYLYSSADTRGLFLYPVREAEGIDTFEGFSRPELPLGEQPQPLCLWINGQAMTSTDPSTGWFTGLPIKKGWNTVLVMMSSDDRSPSNLRGTLSPGKFGKPSDVKLHCQATPPADANALPNADANTLVDMDVTSRAGNKNKVAHITQWLMVGPFDNKPTHQLHVRLAKGDDPTKHQMEWVTRPALFTVPADGPVVRLEGLTFRNAANVAQSGMGVIASPFSVVDNCEFSDSLGRGLTPGHDVTIQNSRFHRNGCVGIGGGAVSRPGLERVKLICNTVTRNNWRRYSHSWESGGIKICGVRNCVIAENVVEDNEAWGIWLDWECRDNQIVNNLCRNNQAAGIFLEGSRVGNVIANNICVDNRVSPGRGWGDGIYMHDTSNALIANNLCIGNAFYGIRVQLATDREWEADKKLVTCNGNRILNNICMDNKTAGIMVPLDAGDRQHGNISDYNLISPLPDGAVGQPSLRDLDDKKLMGMFGPEGSALSKAPRVGLEMWQKMGFDKHGKAGVATFIDAANGDYRPAPGSPAIGMCNVLPEVPQDRTGAKRSAKTAAGPFEASTTKPAK